MVLLMESLMESRGASGSRRISPAPLLQARQNGRAARPRTPTIAEEDCSAQRTAAEQADENENAACCAQQSPCTPPCAAAALCFPMASTAALQLSPCCASPASAPRLPLSALENGMDALALVGATPRPFAAASGGRSDDFSFATAVSFDVDLLSPLPSFAAREGEALTPFTSPLPLADAGCGEGATAAECAESPAVPEAARTASAAADPLMSPAVHCAATAAALCESAMLLGLSLFEETAAVALPRVRSAGRLAAERACGLAAQVQATLDDAQAALDAKRGSAWLRAVLKAMEAEGAKDERRRASSKEAQRNDQLALSHTDLAMLLR